jgi:hypothetical protein
MLDFFRSELQYQWHLLQKSFEDNPGIFIALLLLLPVFIMMYCTESSIAKRKRERELGQ